MGVDLVGGHTEVTVGLSRPLAVGAMLGEAPKDRVVLTSGARPGDAVVVTKGVAVEGTAILARECEGELLRAGVPAPVVDAAKECLFSPGISVVRDATIARDAVEVHSMHDPTEGGIATRAGGDGRRGRRRPRHRRGRHTHPPRLPADMPRPGPRPRWG